MPKLYPTRLVQILPLFALAASSLVTSATQAAVPNPSTLVKAELLGTAPSKVIPGALTVAVRLRIEPEWHIYWLNPGDSGQQTGLKLELPAGFKQVSDWRYPLPIKFTQTGDLIGYGYKDEAIFTTDILPPDGWNAPVTLKAQVIYLVCERVCIPGQAAPSITLTPPQNSPPTPNADIVQAEAKTPLPAPLPAKVSGVLKPGPDQSPAGGPLSPFTAEITFPENAESIEFFPLPESVDLQNLTTTPTTSPGSSVATIKFDAKIYSGTTKPPGNIRLLAVYNVKQDGILKRVGNWVDLPILKPIPPKE